MQPTINDNMAFIEALELFNEKLDKLARLSFMHEMLKKSGVSIKYDENTSISIERHGPDEEAINAFVLTFRFFIQNNENSSLRKLGGYYKSAQISETIKDSFLKHRQILNKFLDDQMDIRFVINGNRLTRRKILDKYIYGELAHANPDKKNEFDLWMANPFMRSMIENEFSYILAILFQIFRDIRDINVGVLEQLRASNP